MEFSVCRPSPLDTYSYVQEENLGSTRKFVEIFLLFTCITNLILALHTQSVNGLEEPFQDSGEKFLQPMRSGCTWDYNVDSLAKGNGRFICGCRLYRKLSPGGWKLDRPDRHVVTQGNCDVWTSPVLTIPSWEEWNILPDLAIFGDVLFSIEGGGNRKIGGQFLQVNVCAVYLATTSLTILISGRGCSRENFLKKQIGRKGLNRTPYSSGINLWIWIGESVLQTINVNYLINEAMLAFFIQHMLIKHFAFVCSFWQPLKHCW